MIYRGHEIRMEGGRYKTYSPRRGYTGSFNTLQQARKWVREQEEAWARRFGPDAGIEFPDDE